MCRLRRKECKAILSVITIMIISILLGNANVAKAAGEINVQYHTKKEILEYFETTPVNYLTASYTTAPSTTQPYAAGELKQEVLEDALAMMKRVRFLAGLSTDLTLDSSYTQQAQAASLVNAVNGSLSHSPSKPDGMDETLYKLGKQGAGSSNIALGYSTLASAVLNAWMEDSDSSNIDRVGHRRWVLNPGMKKVGFGDVYGKYLNWNMHYQAMYAFDNAFNYTGQPSVWPTQVMPVEYFSSVSAWSYSTGTIENASAVQVVLTNETQNKSWSFSASSADGYFNVQNSNYGLPGCIIFRPQDYDSLYKAGDVYKVNITGLSQGDVSYHVSFFSLDTPFGITYDANGGTGSMSDLYVQLGTEYKLPECGFTAPEGLEFVGWKIGAEKYWPGESITVNDDVTVKAVWETLNKKAIIDHASASFEGRIELNFYLRLSDDIVNDPNAKVVFTKTNADPIEMPISRAVVVEDEGTQYCFIYPVVAKEIRDNVNIRVYDGDGNVVTFKNKKRTNDYTTTGVDYSVYTYATRMLIKGDDEMKVLAQALIDYGTAAQINFKYGDYKSLTLPESVTGLTKDDMVGYAAKFYDGNGKEVGKEGFPSGMTNRSISVVFEADNTFKLYYEFAAGVDPLKKDKNGKYPYTFSIDEKPATLRSATDKTGTYYWLELANTPANRLGKVHNLSISDGTKTYIVQCGALAYARSSVINGDEARQNLGKALHLYYLAAKAKFGE